MTGVLQERRNLLSQTTSYNFKIQTVFKTYFSKLSWEARVNGFKLPTVWIDSTMGLPERGFPEPGKNVDIIPIDTFKYSKSIDKYLVWSLNRYFG